MSWMMSHVLLMNMATSVVLTQCHRYYLKAFNILDTDIQLDLSEFVIIALGTQDHNQASSTEECVLRITLASELLEKRAREIRTLGLKKRVVNSLLKYLSDGFRVMQADYRDISRMVEDCVEKVQGLLTDNGGKAPFLASLA